MKRIRILLAAILVPVLLLSGCAFFAPSPPELDFSTKLTPTWTAKAELVGELALAGDAVVSYYLEDDALRVGSWSLKTGELLWSDAADVGAQDPGDGLHLSTEQSEDGRYWVAYNRSDPDEASTSWSYLAVADAQSGNRRALGSPSRPRNVDLAAWVQSNFGACVDLPGFCFWGAIDDGVEIEMLRIDLDDPRVEPVPVEVLPEGAWHAGKELLIDSDGEKGAETFSLIRTIGGAESWRKPFSELFMTEVGGAGVWRVIDDEDGEKSTSTIIGEVAFAESVTLEGGERVAWDLTKRRLIALDGVTGKVLWSKDSVFSKCKAAFLHWPIEGTLPVCHFTSGEIRRDPVTQKEIFTGKTELQGIDIRTGSIIWERDLGSADEHVITIDGAVRLEGHEEWRVVSIDGSMKVLSRRSGDAVSLPDGAIVLCEDSKTWSHQAQNDEPAEDYFIADREFPCTTDRKASPKNIASPGALRMDARDAGNGLWLLSSPDGILAYDSPEPGALQSPSPTPSPTATATMPEG